MFFNIRSLFSKNIINDNDVITELTLKVKDLEAKNNKLNFTLEENELEHRGNTLDYEYKIEKLTRENLKLKNENSEMNSKLSKIASVFENNI
jgi:hypothetical protein